MILTSATDNSFVDWADLSIIKALLYPIIAHDRESNGMLITIITIYSSYTIPQVLLLLLLKFLKLQAEECQIEMSK